MFLVMGRTYGIIITIILIALVMLIIGGIIFLTKFLKASSEDKMEVYTMLNRTVKPGSVVFLGDSLTDFYNTDEFFRNVDQYNRGIANNTTDDVIERLYDNVICIKPKKIFLQIGTNDLGTRKSVDYVVLNIRKIIDMIQVQLPKTEIMLISLYPVNPKASRFSRIIVGLRKNKDIEAVNEKLKVLADELKVTYIDVARFLKDDNGLLNREYTIEGLHLCLHGYMTVSEVLRPYVF